MPRILRKLKVTEISAVPRGAGDDCRIMIMKRYDGDESPQRKRFREIFTGKAFGDAHPAPRYDDEEMRRNATRFQEQREPEEEADVVTGKPILPVKLQQMVDAVRATRPDLTEEQITHFLLHTGRGRSVAEHLSNITKKDEPMSRLEKLQAIAKSLGVETIAKGMVADNDAFDVSEGEFTAMMNAEAARKGMTFTKYFEAPENVDIRKAWQLTRNTRVEKKDSLIKPVSLEPTQTFVGNTSREDDSAEAIRLLMEMAERQAAAGKYRSVASAFAAVFSDQKNATLAARAHRRPNAANAAYPFPR
jgi:hypothetical protein